MRLFRKTNFKLKILKIKICHKNHKKQNVCLKSSGCPSAQCCPGQRLQDRGRQARAQPELRGRHPTYSKLERVAGCVRQRRPWLRTQSSQSILKSLFPPPEKPVIQGMLQQHIISSLMALQTAKSKRTQDSAKRTQTSCYCCWGKRPTDLSKCVEGYFPPRRTYCMISLLSICLQFNIQVHLSIAQGPSNLAGPTHLRC